MECRPWGPTQRGRSSTSSMGFLGPIATPLELETQKMNMETSDGPQKIFWGSGVPGGTQRGRSSTSSMGFLGPIFTPLELETQKMN